MCQKTWQVARVFNLGGKNNIMTFIYIKLDFKIENKLRKNHFLLFKTFLRVKINTNINVKIFVSFLAMQAYFV